MTSLREKIHSKKRYQLQRRFTRPAWLGTVRRLTPLSDDWGFDRGRPVDRYYIERFVEDNRQHIYGRVLEVLDSSYTNRYGINVEQRDVLDINPANTNATIITDLAAADSIGSDTFDCFVLTQTLQYIDDTRAAIFHAHRILRPGGVLLVTVPGISRIARGLETTDYWRFTVPSTSSIFGKVFGAENVTIRSHGNVLTAIAFLTGMACEELSKNELEIDDEYFPVIITIRAVKI